MSGTGNTYRMACWIKEWLSRIIWTDKRLVMIEEADVEKDLAHSTAILVGMLLSDAWVYAALVNDQVFIKDAEVQKGVSALCAATRGAYRVGPVSIPGASGLANFFAAIIMFIKGFRSGLYLAWTCRPILLIFTGDCIPKM